MFASKGEPTPSLVLACGVNAGIKSEMHKWRERDRGAYLVVFDFPAEAALQRPGDEPFYQHQLGAIGFGTLVVHVSHRQQRQFCSRGLLGM